jgi:hypothetical protein
MRIRIRIMGLWCACWWAVHGGTALAGDATPLIRLDHMPLVVKDLEGATDTYRRLGFAIKPGRYHADGIRTDLVKFPDGAGIELITAAAATDALTAHYMRLIGEGDAPAFVCLVTQDQETLTRRLGQMGAAWVADADGLLTIGDKDLGWLFFSGRSNRSPTDRPEHFAHANTADSTLAIWVAGGNRKRMLAFFEALGARIMRKQVYVPGPLLADVARLNGGGEIIFLPGNRQIIPGRPVVGIVMHIRDVSAARRVLTSAGVAPMTEQRAPYPRIVVAPRDARNVWLELTNTADTSEPGRQP